MKNKNVRHSGNKTFDLRQRMLNHLLLRSGTTPDIGLLHGKTGLIILFYHCSKYFNNTLYEEFANELMDELAESLDNEMRIGFEYGLCGIGWGIDYLIGNNFVEGESYWVCEEIDKKIMQTDPRRIMDYTLETGLTGLLHYVLIHVKTCMQQGSTLPFDETYFYDLYHAVNAIPENKQEEGLDTLISLYNIYYTEKTIPNYIADIRLVFEKVDITDDNLTNLPIGLRKGIGGTLLSSIFG